MRGNHTALTSNLISEIGLRIWCMLLFLRGRKKTEPWLLDQLCPLGNDGNKAAKPEWVLSKTLRAAVTVLLSFWSLCLCSHCPCCRPLIPPPIPDHFFPSQEPFSFWKFPLLKRLAYRPPDAQVVGYFEYRDFQASGDCGHRGKPLWELGPFMPGVSREDLPGALVHDILMGLFWQSFWCISVEAATTMPLFWLGILIRPLSEAVFFFWTICITG